MVDVVFLLLVFFMTVAQLSEVAGRPEITPPASSEAERRERLAPGTVVVSVARPGPGAEPSFVLADRRLKAAEVAPALREIARERAGTYPLLVAADADLEFTEVRRVLEAARDAGLADVALEAVRRPEEGVRP
jgi:biopolymer transport protein ExbD